MLGNDAVAGGRQVHPVEGEPGIAQVDRAPQINVAHARPGEVASLQCVRHCLLLCALPALDAHTRLLFGRRLEYRVTEKVPVQARFRDQQGAPQLKPIRDPAPLRRTAFDQLPQYRAYSPGSTTAVTDSVLLVYRDLR